MLANSSDEDGETEFVDIFNVHLIRNNTHVRKKAMMKKSPSKKYMMFPMFSNSTRFKEV